MAQAQVPLFAQCKPYALAVLTALKEQNDLDKGQISSTADAGLSRPAAALDTTLAEALVSIGDFCCSATAKPELTPALVDFLIVPVFLAFNQSANRPLPRTQEASLRLFEILAREAKDAFMGKQVEATGDQRKAAAKRADEVAIRCLATLQTAAGGVINAGKAQPPPSSGRLKAVPSEEAGIFACRALCSVILCQFDSEDFLQGPVSPYCLSAGFVGAAVAELVSIVEGIAAPSSSSLFSVAADSHGSSGATSSPSYHRPLLKACLESLRSLLPVVELVRLSSSTSQRDGAPSRLLPKIFPGVFSCMIKLGSGILTFVEGETSLPVGATQHRQDLQGAVGKVLLTSLGRGGVAPLAIELVGRLIAALSRSAVESLQDESVLSLAEQIGRRLTPLLRPLVLALKESKQENPPGQEEPDDEGSRGLFGTLSSSLPRLREALLGLCHAIVEAPSGAVSVANCQTSQLDNALLGLRVEAVAALCLFNESVMGSDTSAMPIVLGGIQAVGAIIKAADGAEPIAAASSDLLTSWQRVLRGYNDLARPSGDHGESYLPPAFAPEFIALMLVSLLRCSLRQANEAELLSVFPALAGDSVEFPSAHTRSLQNATRRVIFLLEATCDGVVSEHLVSSLLPPAATSLWMLWLKCTRLAAHHDGRVGDGAVDGENRATGVLFAPIGELLRWSLTDGPGATCTCDGSSVQRRQQDKTRPCYLCLCSRSIIDHSTTVLLQAVGADLLSHSRPRSQSQPPFSGEASHALWQRFTAFCRFKASLLSLALQSLSDTSSDSEAVQPFVSAALCQVVNASRAWLISGSSAESGFAVMTAMMTAEVAWERMLSALEDAALQSSDGEDDSRLENSRASPPPRRGQGANSGGEREKGDFPCFLQSLQQSCLLALREGRLDISLPAQPLLGLLSSALGPGAAIVGGPMHLQQQLSTKEVFLASRTEELFCALGAAVAAAVLNATTPANKNLLQDAVGESSAKAVNCSLILFPGGSTMLATSPLPSPHRKWDDEASSALALSLLSAIRAVSLLSVRSFAGHQVLVGALRAFYRKTRTSVLPWLLAIAQRVDSSDGPSNKEQQRLLTDGTSPAFLGGSLPEELVRLQRQVLKAYLEGFPLRGRAAIAPSSRPCGGALVLSGSNSTLAVSSADGSALDPSHCLALAQAATDISPRVSSPAFLSFGRLGGFALTPLQTPPVPDSFLLRSLGFAAGQCAVSLTSATRSLASSGRNGQQEFALIKLKEGVFPGIALASSALTTLSDAKASIRQRLMAHQAGSAALAVIAPAGTVAPSEMQSRAPIDTLFERQALALREWGLLGNSSRKDHRRHEALSRALEADEDIEALYDQGAFQPETSSHSQGSRAGGRDNWEDWEIGLDNESDEAKRRREEADDDLDGAGFAAVREERLMMAFASLGARKGEGKEAGGAASDPQAEGGRGSGLPLLQLEGHVVASLSRAADLSVSLAFCAGISTSTTLSSSSGVPFDPRAAGLIVGLSSPADEGVSSPTFTGSPIKQASERLVSIEALRVMETLHEEEKKEKNEGEERELPRREAIPTPRLHAAAAPVHHPRVARASLVCSRRLKEAAQSFPRLPSKSGQRGTASSSSSPAASPLAMLLPVLPLPLVGPLLTVGKAACGELQGIGPYSLSLAASLERQANIGTATLLPSALPFLLPAARSALYQLLCTATALLAYPSVQYPFVAQSAWPALATLLPQPSFMRALAQRFLDDALVVLAASASDCSGLSDGSSHQAALAKAGASDNADAALGSRVEHDSLSYLDARRRRRTTLTAGDAGKEGQAKGQERLVASTLALGWLQGLSADVLMTVAALIDFPKGEAVASSQASSSNLSILALSSSSPSSTGNGKRPPHTPIGGCCGDFLRGRLREAVFPCVLAALQAEASIAAATLTACNNAGHTVLSGSRAVRKRLLFASLRVILVLARPCATVPRDDNDAEDGSPSVNWKNPDGKRVENSGGPTSSAHPTKQSWEPLPAVMPLSFNATSGGTEDADEGARRRRLQLSPEARMAAKTGEQAVSAAKKKAGSLTDAEVSWSSPILTRGEAGQLLACVRLLRLLNEKQQQRQQWCGPILAETEAALVERIAGADE